MSSESNNMDICRRLIEVVNTRHYDGMDDLFDPSFVDHNPAWGAAGLADLKQVLNSAHSALEMMITLDDIFAVDNKVTVRITLTGTHIDTFFGLPASGKQVSWTSIEIYRFENGKIVERWVQADTAGLMKQLGLIS
ncbi:MAG: ester cyclase [Xenococcaceae cyanobacterium MO_234.B1]|nr:ester cyclase [Xenococcaceae cyanobacterium MO_234.B1]